MTSNDFNNVMTKSEPDCHSLFNSCGKMSDRENDAISTDKQRNESRHTTTLHSSSVMAGKVGSKLPMDRRPENLMKRDLTYKPVTVTSNTTATNGVMSRSAHGLQLQNLTSFNGTVGGKDKSLGKDDIIATMDTICKMVKTNQFTPQLNSSVFQLYDYLKEHGESMEATNRNELNQVFIAIRQACCRDAGQLGTPCRLKMMELIELRALKWRPSLSHSQYYVGKSQQQHATTTPQAQPVPQVTPVTIPPPSFTPPSRSHLSTPASAPPFGAVAMNPFTFAMRPHASPVSPAEMFAAAAAANTPPSPSYYLIPAGGHHHHHAAFLQSPTLAGAGLLPTPPPGPQAMFHSGAHLVATPTGFLSPAHHLALNPFAAAAGLAAAAAAAAAAAESKKAQLAGFPQPTKIPGKTQFRDEVVIRNSDSGKIMGVKGRRVSIIEELSQTIISFQKVAQNAKERTLTLTGPNEESLLHAKLLIEDTIRRNVSPTREGSDLNDLKSRSEQETLSDLTNVRRLDDHCGGGGDSAAEDAADDYDVMDGDDDPFAAEGDSSTGGHLLRGSSAELECALSEMGSILKLSCADPQVLKVARQALREYFHRRDRPASMRRISTEGGGYRYISAYNKERRKSMPLPLNQLDNLIEGNESDNQTPKSPNDSVDGDQLAAQLKFNARSTPNLFVGLNRISLKQIYVNNADPINQDVENGERRPRIVYTRDFLLKFSKSAENNVEKESIFPEICEESVDAFKEILQLKPRMFDIEAYKKKFLSLKYIRI